LGTVDEEEGVILAKGIVHGSLPRHRGFRCRTVLITILQGSHTAINPCSLRLRPPLPPLLPQRGTAASLRHHPRCSKWPHVAT
jgi:hypothetical protein